MEFARGPSRRDLDSDRMLVLAIIKSIEMVGEAAARVTQQTRDSHPALPWAGVVAMRHRLIHAYFDVDLDRVWDTVADDLPTLVPELETICAP